MKVLSISEDGKISLSIKRAMEQQENKGEPRQRTQRRERREPQKVDSSFVWTSKKSESESFEEMMNRFKQTSEEKFSDLKRKNPDAKRSRRG